MIGAVFCWYLLTDKKETAYLFELANLPVFPRKELRYWDLPVQKDKLATHVRLRAHEHCLLGYFGSSCIAGCALSGDIRFNIAAKT
jgi:hypothetical protein